MPDTRLVDLADGGFPEDDDVLYGVDVSSGAPRDRKFTIEDLRVSMVAALISEGRALSQVIRGTTSGATPVTLTPSIPTTYGPHFVGSMTFSALFTASKITGGGPPLVAGYEIKGLIRKSDETPTAEIVGVPFRTTFGEDADWTVAAFIDGTDGLSFTFTAPTGGDIRIVGLVTFLYAHGDL